MARPGDLRVLTRVMSVHAQNELQYRSNFVVQLMTSASQIGVAFASLALVLHRTDSLNGWTGDQLLAFIGVYTLVAGLTRTFVEPAMMRLLSDIHRGEFDAVLTKPVDTQLLVSIRAVNIWQGIDVVAGLAVIAVAVGRLHASIGWADAVWFVVLLGCALVIVRSVWLIIGSLAFWFVRLDWIDALFFAAFRAAQYPITIYPGWLRVGLSTVLPVGLALTAPAGAITSRLSLAMLFGALAVALATSWLSAVIFRRALGAYSSASS